MPRTMDSPDLIEFGNKMKKRRKQLKMTQEELAELVDVTGNTIHRIESAQTSTSVERLFQIAEALKTRPETLFPARFYEKPESKKQAEEMITQLLAQLNHNNQQMAYQMIFPILNGLIQQQHQ